MPWTGKTCWIGPVSNARTTFWSPRVWRWSDADYDAIKPWWHPGDDVHELYRMRAGIDHLAPGHLEPGLALLSEGGRLVCALGRHPRRQLESGRTEDALLVPQGAPYRAVPEASLRVVGTAVTEENGATSLRDAGGTERARLSKASGGLAGLLLPVTLAGRTLTVGRQESRIEQTRAGRFGGTTGLRLIDTQLGHAHATALAEEGRALRGEVTHSLLIAWEQEPDLWGHAALLLLVALMIDFNTPMDD